MAKDLAAFATSVMDSCNQCHAGLGHAFLQVVAEGRSSLAAVPGLAGVSADPDLRRGGSARPRQPPGEPAAGLATGGLQEQGYVSTMGLGARRADL